MFTTEPFPLLLLVDFLVFDRARHVPFCRMPNVPLQAGKARGAIIGSFNKGTVSSGSLSELRSVDCTL